MYLIISQLGLLKVWRLRERTRGESPPVATILIAETALSFQHASKDLGIVIGTIPSLRQQVKDRDTQMHNNSVVAAYSKSPIQDTAPIEWDINERYPVAG